MSDEIKLLDVVALTVDVPEHNLLRGQVGTVAERASPEGRSSHRRKRGRAAEWPHAARPRAWN